MEFYFRYILIATVCLSTFYLGYVVLLKKEIRFIHRRYFFLGSILLALVLPLTTASIPLDFPTNNKKYEKAPQLEKVYNWQSIDQNVPYQEVASNSQYLDVAKKWTINQILASLYFIGLLIIILRLSVHLVMIYSLYRSSEKKKHNEGSILISEKIKSPFTFFQWVFVPADQGKGDEIDIILKHERVHATQYHSVDLFLIELLSAIMWFNPLVWFMRKSMQTVHEYLADEGVLRTGVDKLKYQALLINQIAEERLISLSSSFNHSLIKKRMIMMTKSQFNHSKKLRILALIPIAIFLFIGVSCLNYQNKTNVGITSEGKDIDVLYIGIANPIKIEVPGYDTSDVTVSIDNGTISGEYGAYIIRPEKFGKASLTVSSEGAEIQKKIFKIKVDPEQLKQLEGEYIVTKKHKTEWKLAFKMVDGKLVANSFGHKYGKRYKMTAVGNNEFIRGDNATLVFDTQDKNAITVMLKGRKIKFDKVSTTLPAIYLWDDTIPVYKDLEIKDLKLLEGEYMVANSNKDLKTWKIGFKAVDGELVGNDGGSRYRLIPVGRNVFINYYNQKPMVFDTQDKNAISLMFDGRKRLNKVSNSLSSTKSLDYQIPVYKKQGLDQLLLLEGEYVQVNSIKNDKKRKLKFKVVDGELTGNDIGYKYKFDLIPIGNNSFINPNDGASLVFDTKDKNSITMILFDRIKLKKIN